MRGLVWFGVLSLATGLIAEERQATAPRSIRLRDGFRVELLRSAQAEARRQAAKTAEMPVELGGRDGPEPVRYGDYEKKGLCVDF